MRDDNSSSMETIRIHSKTVDERRSVLSPVLSFLGIGWSSVAVIELAWGWLAVQPPALIWTGLAKGGLLITLAAGFLYWRMNRSVSADRLAPLIVDAQSSESSGALNALRDERDRFEKLVETSPAVICSFQMTSDGKVFFPYASKKIEDIYGIPADQLQKDATPIFSMTHSEDLAALQESVSVSARDLTVWHAEFRIKHPQRGEVWVEGRSSPVRGQDGSTIWHGFITDITDRKLSEVALKESEWRFRKVFEDARTGIGITDADGKFLQCNPAYCAVLGRTEEELRQADFGSLIHPDDREENVSLLRKLAAGEIKNYEIENRFLHSSGKAVWVHKTVSALEGEPGRAAFLMALVTDVTERRRAEQVLREGEERLRLAVEAGDLGVWEYLPATDVAIRSLRHDQMFGYSELQPVWGIEVVLKHVHEDDKELYRQALQRGLESGEFSVQMRVRWPDGSIHWLDVRGRTEFDSSNRPLRMRGVIADVTDRVRSAESLRSVLASVTDAILTIDEQGRIETANPATEVMFGYRLSELVGNSIQVLMREPIESFNDDAVAESTVDGQKKVYNQSRSVAGLRSDGSTFPADLTISEFRLDDTHRYTGVIRDNSAREKLEAQLRQSHKMEAIGRLAGGVAHDFNNLLTVINGYSELMLDELACDDQNRTGLLTIREAGERAAALTSQLLAFSRKAMIAPKVFDLLGVLRQSERLLRRLLGEDIAIIVYGPENACWLLADVHQINQVIMNLAVNARDAMPKGGRITITINCIELTVEDWRSVHGLAPGRYVELVFEDTGAGMPEEVQSRIFEPFFTTKGEGEGTGLGLSTVFGIVQQAGGQIGVNSQVGHGTQFRLLFPLSAPPAPATKAEQGSSFIAEGGKLILLVEDDASVRRLMHSALEAHGYIVLSAASGEDAWSLLEELPLGVDLLLTDVIMPGLSGSELAQKVQSQWPETKVLFMSGYADDAVHRHGVKDECVVFLQKPFIPSDLVNKVHTVLDDNCNLLGIRTRPIRG